MRRASFSERTFRIIKVYRSEKDKRITAQRYCCDTPGLSSRYVFIRDHIFSAHNDRRLLVIIYTDLETSPVPKISPRLPTPPSSLSGAEPAPGSAPPRSFHGGRRPRVPAL